MQVNLKLKVSLGFLIFFSIGLYNAKVALSKQPIVSSPTADQESRIEKEHYSLNNGELDASLLVQQGRELYEAEKFPQAVQVWQQAAKAYQAKKDTISQAMVLSNLSLAYQQLGQWNGATSAIAQSLNLLGYSGVNRAGGAGGAGGAQELGGTKENLIRLEKFGAPQTDTATPVASTRLTRAQHWLNFSQNSKSKVQNLQVLAQALNTQGSLQLALGQAQQALNTWQQATAIYAKAGDRLGMTRSQINQAQAMQAIGLYRRGLKTLSEVNQTLQKQPDSQTKAAFLRNLGNALRVVGDIDQSEQRLQQSLAIAQKLQLPQDIGATLFSLGNTLRASRSTSLTQQDNGAALKFYQQAATISPSQITKLQAQLNQLSLLLDTDRLDEANALIPQIQSKLTNLPPSSKTVYAQIDFAQTLMKLGAREDKGQGGQGGLGGQRGLGGDEEIGRWSESPLPHHPIPSSASSPHPSPLTPRPLSIAQILATAVQQARGLGDKRAEAYALGNLGSLYEQQEQWSSAKDLTRQALVLAQSVNAPDIAYRWQWQLGRLLKVQGDTKGAIAIYTEAVKTLKSLRTDLVAINPEIQFDFRDQVEPVYRELVDLLLDSSANQPSQQNLTLARQTIESLQIAELDNFFREACLEAQTVSIDKVVDQENPTAAVIYPIILRDRLEVILKLPKQPLRHYTVQVSQSQVEQTLEQLRENLTEPDRIKNVRTLSQQVYKWLIEPAQTELASSGIKTLVFVPDGALRNIPMSALYDGKQYLVEKYAIALSPGLQLVSPKPLPPGQLRALTAGLSIAPANYPYPPLPAVRSELNLIEQAGVSSSELLDKQFTSKRLETKIDSSTFNVVHLATHGQFSSSAQNTFILASDGPINVKEFDNLLRNRNQRTPEAIELLVLSACQTATGDKRAALGLAGVAVRAGARSTLASLWQIDDEATAIFIGEFYQELAKTGVNKAEALRQAQLTLIKNYPNYSRPSYWSPYVLIGNWL